MESRCSWCYRWLVREGDTPMDIRVKQGMAPLAYFFIPAGLYWLYQWITIKGISIVFSAVVHLTYVLPLIAFLVKAKLGHPMGKAVDWFVLGGCLGCIGVDWFAAAEARARYWNCMVMILDAVLVFERDRMAPIVVIMTLAYLCFESLESYARFGLYEVFTDPTILMCDCADPPCPTSFSNMLSTYALSAVVLLTDFYLTRGFASNLRLQLRRVNTSVEVAEKIAAALAKYDVEVAEAVIKGGDDLPEGLAQSFMQLLSNLRSYKAYLPHSCLVHSDAHGNEESSEEGTANGSGVALQSPRRGEPGESDSSSDPTPHGSFSSGTGSQMSGNQLTERGVTSALKAIPRRTRVSLAAGNMLGYLSSHSDLAGEANTEWISTDVERWCAVVAVTKGVVDLIGGDRRYASFNARQRCGDHARAAVEALSSRGDGAWSGCVVTGQAVCGDFGSVSVLRFMVLG
eukprot:Hpha_TRINITY_DN15344_c9_g4::TRINITY_DN15344_c9_g4_i4::g.89602::m.89602